MATPPTIRGLTREALGSIPEWFDRVLQPLNQFLQQSGDALEGNLTPGRNLAQQWLQVTAVGINSTSAEPIQPQALPRLKGKAPFGVSVERVQVVEGAINWFPSVDWEPATVEGKPGLKIKTVYGLDPGAVATLTILVKAE